jgi:hypothetical protein
MLLHEPVRIYRGFLSVKIAIAFFSISLVSRSNHRTRGNRTLKYQSSHTDGGGTPIQAMVGRGFFDTYFGMAFSDARQSVAFMCNPPLPVWQHRPEAFGSSICPPLISMYSGQWIKAYALWKPIYH